MGDGKKDICVVKLRSGARKAERTSGRTFHFR